MNLEIHESPEGHYMTDGQHKIFFLCKKEAWCNKSCEETTCAHTLYMERSKNYADLINVTFTFLRNYSEEKFLERFEKLYFTEDNYDWWEKEKKPIWMGGRRMNCKGCKHFREPYTNFPCTECKRIQRGRHDHWVSEEGCDNCKYLFTNECEYPCSDCNMLNTLYENNHFTPKEEDKMNCKEENDCQKPKPDNVNHPSHYESSCSLECIEAMEIMFGLQYVYSFCLCNAWKYIWRYKNKNGIEDMKKARWYIDRAKWYEYNYGDEIYYPNKALYTMNNWLLEHDIV